LVPRPDGGPGNADQGETEATIQDARQSDSRQVRIPSLISRFEQNTKSGDPFGLPEMVQAVGAESIRDDAFPIATSIAIIGSVKEP